MDVVVIGAGPAGVLAAARAADLGARTTLVSSAELGGMAANDGPVPIRALAYAARLMQEARDLPRYGITVGELALQYDELLARVGAAGPSRADDDRPAAPGGVLSGEALQAVSLPHRRRCGL
jgi:pyruvate/2-oxoglutarate dehydrogenase complex dihydrolipoamide dehydrogenase (E3) component